MADSFSNFDGQRAFPRRIRTSLCIGSAAIALAALAAADPAWADDVTISANTNTGVDLDTQIGTTVEVQSGVTVSNAPITTVIKATTGAWTLTNRGIVTADAAQAISLAVAGSSVVNFGAINAINSLASGIALVGGGSVDNKLGATINVVNAAITIGKTGAGATGEGNVINAGTITGSSNASDLVALLFGGSVTNLSTGVITANNGSNAVSVGQGTVRTVINSGTIINNGAGASGFATGVLVQGGPATVTNNAGARITGLFNGVFASSTTPLTFTNAGLIESTGSKANSRAVEATGGGTFINTGTIQSATSDGLFLGRAGTVTNSGTISGAPRAMNFSGNFARTLNLTTGSVLNGLVQGGTGVDDLVLMGTGTEDISKFLAFETLSQTGSAWTLNGAGTFTTSAGVQAGTLTVAGTLTSPTMTVASGGTLKGTGTIAGATSIANGGTLAGSSGQLLTMSSLALNGNSNINVALGAPSGTALFSVTNALTLDGMLNVTNAGGFGLGTYRLINYGGALTNNGLTIQSLPNGFNPGDWSIDTATAGQVNLSVAVGSGEQFWDGPNMTPGNVANGRGGTGTWNAANTNWTNQAGTINAPWASQNAVFAAAGASTVTIDGAQTFTGLRFLSNANYSLVAGANGSMVTAGAAPEIAVDQGGSALIAAPITGSSGLTKSGTGTLILTASNSYGGTTMATGTMISAGTLQVGNGGTSGTVGSLYIVNNGTLIYNRSDNIGNVQIISGTGNIIKSGAGALQLYGANSYTGGTTINSGTLRIRADNGLGAASGGVAINGATLQSDANFTTTRTITLNGGGTLSQASDTRLFANGVVSGTGGLTKAGAGTLILNNTNNNYSGGTTINAGTLRISADANLGAAGGGLTINGATLETDASFATARTITQFDGAILNQSTGTTLTLSGRIRGAGVLTKAGAGTLILTGANDFQGDTVINGGILRISSDDNLGMPMLTAGGSPFSFVTINGATLQTDASFQLQRNITLTNGAILNQAGGTTLLVRGAVGGTGGLTKAGTGTLTLNSANTYTGDTVISAGVLQIGNGGTTGSINGNVANNGTLVFNRSNAVTFAGVISGGGALIKQGAGTLILSGNSPTYTGAAMLQAGTLDLAGSLGGSLTVASGTRLQGIGTGGAVSVASGGTVAPGNSIGTLNVGSINFAPGSIYEVEANAAGQADRITATGTATINGGTVQVLAQNGSYGLNTTYTILSAGGGVSGPGFSGATSNLAFLAPSLQQTANSVLLTLKRNAIDFAAVGGTPSQVSVGAAVQRLGTGAVFNAVLGLDAPGARVAFDALSGEIHPSLRTTLLEDSRLPREAVLRRMSGEVEAQKGIWGEGFGDWGTSDSDGNAAKLSRDSTGLVMGIDAAAGDSWRVGIAGGYTHHKLGLPARASSGRVNMIHALAYAGATYGPIRVALGAGYAHVDARTDRTAAFAGFNDRLTADYNGSILQGFGEVGARLPLGGGVAEPFAQLAVIHVKTDRFAESGGAAALSGASRGETRTISTLGLHMQTPIVGNLSADGRIGWRHAFGSQTSLAAMRFAGGTDFLVAGVPHSRDAAVAEIGLNVQAGSNLTIWARYSGVLGDRGVNNAVKGGFRLAF